MGINAHLDDIGRQFYDKVAKVNGFFLATVLFNKRKAYQKEGKAFCTVKADCSEFLKWKYAATVLDYDKAKVEELKNHAKFLRIGKIERGKIAELLESEQTQARKKIEKIIMKEAKRIAHHGMVKNYAILLKVLLLELRDYLPFAEQVVLVADEKFETKMDKKQLGQIIINTIRGRIRRPRPKILFRNSRGIRCLQAVDVFCNLFYSYGRSTLDTPSDGAILHENDFTKKKWTKDCLEVHDILKPKIVVWQQPESWAEVNQRAKAK